MKFLADMGISPKTVSFLQQLGHEASHLHQEGLDRLSDSEILLKARREGSILLTHDLDFGDLLAAGGTDLPSVVIFRLRNMHPGKVNQYLSSIIVNYTADLKQGAIVTVSESGIRMRNLPIKTS